MTSIALLLTNSDPEWMRTGYAGGSASLREHAEQLHDELASDGRQRAIDGAFSEPFSTDVDGTLASNVDGALVSNVDVSTQFQLGEPLHGHALSQHSPAGATRLATATTTTTGTTTATTTTATGRTRRTWSTTTAANTVKGPSTRFRFLFP